MTGPGPIEIKASNARKHSPLSRALAVQTRVERAVARVTVEAMCQRSGISRSTYLRIESGDRVMDTGHLDRICEALGIDPVTFVARAVQRATDG